MPALQLARKLAAASAATTYEDSLDYATEEGDHTIHKCKEAAEDWEDHAAHLAELIAKVGRVPLRLRLALAGLRAGAFSKGRCLRIRSSANHPISLSDGSWLHAGTPGMPSARLRNPLRYQP